jgi:hypothetical protein
LAWNSLSTVELSPVGAAGAFATVAALTAVMVYSLNNFISKLNKILSAENLSEQEK